MNAHEEMETDFLSSSSSQHLQLDPLQIENIVSKILSFLSSSSLKQARQVCKCWRNEGRGYLVTRSYIRLNLTNMSPSEKKSECNALFNFLRVPSSHKDLKIVASDASLWDVIYMLNHVPGTAERVRVLKYECLPNGIIRNLPSVLDKLHQLEVLQTPVLQYNPFQQYNMDERGVGDNFWRANPTNFDWKIAFNLGALKTLQLTSCSSVDEASLWRSLAIALQLPQLENFSMDYLPPNWNGMLKQWTAHFLAQGRRFQSTTIKSVEFNCPIHPSSSWILTGRLWPGVKELKVKITPFTLALPSTPDPDPGPYPNRNPKHSNNFFSSWLHLDTLELEFCPWSGSEEEDEQVNFGPHDIEEWLTGIKCPPHNCDENSILSPEINSDHRLRNLESLKRLTIRVAPEYKNFNGDFLINNCLIHMKNLHTLYLQGVKASEEELDNLKLALENQTKIYLF